MTLEAPYTRADAIAVRHGFYLDIQIGHDHLSKSQLDTLRGHAAWITALLSDDANDDDLADYDDALMLIDLIEAEGSRRKLKDSIQGVVNEARAIVAKKNDDGDDNGA